jgi:hypothetical protein
MDVKIGSLIFFYPRSGYGGHGAYIRITKINAKSFSGEEIQTSYKPNNKWRISKLSPYAVVSYVDNLQKTNWINT